MPKTTEPTAVTLPLDELETLCRKAARNAGARKAIARSLAAATVAAEADGQKIVGLSHFFDYIDALRAGRIDGRAKPKVKKVRPGMFHADAGGGLAQLGFDKTFKRLVKAAKKRGVAVFSQANAYTCGSLGYHVERLAHEGLVALATTTAPALVAGGGATKPVYGTNPMAFAAPVDGSAPLLIDQSSSATAFVNVRAAAEAGKAIPEGWAIDRDGRPTTDAKAAIEGALLAFGGARGGNVALMVEVLAAGLSGAAWCLDSAPLFAGTRPSNNGLFIVALDPDALTKGFAERLAAQLQRLSGEYGVHIPGRSKGEAAAKARTEGVALDAALVRRLRNDAGETSEPVKPA